MKNIVFISYPQNKFRRNQDIEAAKINSAKYAFFLPLNRNN